MSGKNSSIVAIILVVVGVGVWWVASDPISDAERAGIEELPESLEGSDNDGQELPSGLGRLMELYERGVSMECAFTYHDENGEGEGTGFFDGDNMRISTTYNEQGTTFISNVINDGTSMFVWGEAPEGGFAMQMAATEESMTEMESEFDDSTALNEEVAYDCREWTVDASVFTPPADIEFMNMDSMMEEMMQGIPDLEGMDPAELEAMMERMP